MRHPPGNREAASSGSSIWWRRILDNPLKRHEIAEITAGQRPGAKRIMIPLHIWTLHDTKEISMDMTQITRLNYFPKLFFVFSNN